MYRNCYGMLISADFYMAKDADIDIEYPAIIIAVPYGGIRERETCVSANELAQVRTKKSAFLTQVDCIIL